MKGLFIASLIMTAAMSAVVAQIPTGDTPSQVTVNTANANLRSDPTARSKVSGRVTKGTVLDVYAYEPNEHWYLVKHGNVVGWIKESLASPLPRDLSSLPDIPAGLDAIAGLKKKYKDLGWDAYSITGDESRIYFYKPSMTQRAGNISKVWSKGINRDLTGEADDLVAIDCTRFQFAVLNSITYEPNGSVRSHVDLAKVAKPGPISPDSVIYALSHEICKTDPNIY